jgi:hypothetical protein
VRRIRIAGVARSALIVVYRLDGDADAFCAWQESTCEPIRTLPSE